MEGRRPQATSVSVGDRNGDDITKKPIHDIRVAIWAVWMLSGDLESNDKWPDPWKSPTDGSRVT
jgi:hypothetical protein